MNRSYTIFHFDDETFSILWSEYNYKFKYFYPNYLNNLKTYGEIKKYFLNKNLLIHLTFPVHPR